MNGHPPRQERDLVKNLELHQTELASQHRQLQDTHQLLEESRSRYADLYDLAPVGYCSLDTNGQIVEINRAAARLLTRSTRTDILGRPLTVYFDAASRSALRNHLMDCLRHGDGEARVQCVTSGHGQAGVRTVEVTSAPIVDHPGAAARGLRTVLNDVTERVVAEEKLRAAAHMRQEFLARVSHELRNPLNSILMAAEVLKMRLSSNRPREAEVIKGACEHMGRLVTDLLDLSCIDAGHFSIERTAHQITPLIQTAIELARMQAGPKGVDLSSVLDDPLPAVACDGDRIVQVLGNLLANAIKFTAPGGRITVRVAQVADRVRVSVEDTGCGMSADQIARVFDPYWQGSNRGHMGAGLGMAIAKGIVELHEGSIWVVSTLDHGSTFHFDLPCLDDAQVGGSFAPAPSDAEHSEKRPATVLLVDDETETRETLAALLRNHHYRVIGASHGKEALDILRRGAEQIGVVLLDLMMPVMDGWQFLAERSRDSAIANVPVILVSAQADAQLAARRHRLEGVAPKPVNVGQLLTLVATTLGLRPRGA